MTTIRPFVLAFAVTAALHGPAEAQQGWRFLPGGTIPRIRANPREPNMSVRLIAVANGDSRFEEGVEWEVHFGHGIPFIRFSGNAPDEGVVLGVRGGVFGRFSFETKKRDLISSDWVFEAPLFIHQGGDNWIRIRYQHISSHLGDDYIGRFAVQTEGYLRDVFGILAHREVLPGLRVYGGGDFAWNVDPNVNKRWSFTAGVGYDRTNRVPTSRVSWGSDLYVDQDASWTPRVNVHTGIRLLSQRQHNLRLVVEALFGSSPQGEFRRTEAILLSMGLVIDLP